jgi:hypothetical protein
LIEGKFWIVLLGSPDQNQILLFDQHCGKLDTDFIPVTNHRAFNAHTAPLEEAVRRRSKRTNFFRRTRKATSRGRRDGRSAGRAEEQGEGFDAKRNVSLRTGSSRLRVPHASPAASQQCPQLAAAG